MVYSLPGSSVQRILQARVLEWVAILFSRGSPPPRDRTWVEPGSPELQVDSFLSEPLGKPLIFFFFFLIFIKASLIRGYIFFFNSFIWLHWVFSCGMRYLHLHHVGSFVAGHRLVSCGERS